MGWEPGKSKDCFVDKERGLVVKVDGWRGSWTIKLLLPEEAFQIMCPPGVRYHRKEDARATLQNFVNGGDSALARELREKQRKLDIEAEKHRALALRLEGKADRLCQMARDIDETSG